jgi:hypothetical protein
MRTVTICIVVALAACKSDPPSPSAPPPEPTTPVTAGAPGSQNLAPLAGLSARMQEEATRRPAVEVTAEALFRALGERGITIASQKQVLAATAQASYCALGVTAETIAIAVCEYATREAAAAGKRLLDTRYAQLVPDAVRALNGTTLITIAHGARHRDVRDRVLETFQSL